MILGIETSCDETAAAVVGEDGEIKSNVVSSQAHLHARFGGVVPEVAARLWGKVPERSYLPELAATSPEVREYASQLGSPYCGPAPPFESREWFDDDAYDAHLEWLESDQLEDGGWPIAWEPPGPASVAAWSAIVTIDALRTLAANGRLER